jgi:hypothetical protein
VGVEVLPEDTDDMLSAALYRWVGRLAAGDFEGGVDQLRQDADANRQAASAADLRAWIERYEPAPPLRPDRPARVTPAETAGGPLEPLMEVFRADDGTVKSVDFSMPINGEWSELVAFFDVVPVAGGFALSLSDMYVA